MTTAPSRPDSRSRSAAETLALARRLAPVAGIREVTDITDLDRLELPVFASVRPESRADVVTFGKGRTKVDAEVAAYMEAIEFYFAEPDAGCVATRWGTADDLDPELTAEQAIAAHIPLAGKQPAPGAPMLLACSEDLETGRPGLVPAERVLRPAPDVGGAVFGSSTNGLASGNSPAEASLFALFELIERDIWSLEMARQRSQLVAPDSLPAALGEIAERCEQLGLGLKLRSVANDYRLPMFAAFLFDAKQPRFETFNGGFGCAFDPQSAALQAVLEAAQGRLGFLYGGRDQAAKLDKKFAPEGAQQAAAVVAEQIDKVSDARTATAFAEVAPAPVSGSIDAQLQGLLAILRRVSPAPVQRVVYTPTDADLHTVRLLVPGLEHYRVGQPRIGARLKAALREAPSHRGGA